MRARFQPISNASALQGIAAQGHLINNRVYIHSMDMKGFALRSGSYVQSTQTCSRPIKGRVNYLGTPKDVLIFAAKYDDSNDNKTVRTNDQEGRGFFIVDADTGSLITKRRAIDFTGMNYSMPSDIRVLNIDNDGFADMHFVGDMGGQVWRFDINNEATSDKTFISGAVIADFASSQASVCSASVGNGRVYTVMHSTQMR